MIEARLTKSDPLRSPKSVSPLLPHKFMTTLWMIAGDAVSDEVIRIEYRGGATDMGVGDLAEHDRAAVKKTVDDVIAGTRRVPPQELVFGPDPMPLTAGPNAAQ